MLGASKGLSKGLSATFSQVRSVSKGSKGFGGGRSSLYDEIAENLKM
jgi:hypothetical protein